MFLVCFCANYLCGFYCRTEQILSGIVKLVEDDDVLTEMAKPTQTKTQMKARAHSTSSNSFGRKKPLQASKSTPSVFTKSKSEFLLNIKSIHSQSKPSSPTNTTRRFPCELSPQLNCN